jgi:hypothetical protein
LYGVASFSVKPAASAAAWMSSVNSAAAFSIANGHS